MARGACSSTVEFEAASVSLPDWTPGGGTAVLNEAAQDVWARLQAQATALHNYNQEFLATRTTFWDYHNLRVSAFNSHVRELSLQTADLSES